MWREEKEAHIMIETRASAGNGNDSRLGQKLRCQNGQMNTVLAKMLYLLS